MGAANTLGLYSDVDAGLACAVCTPSCGPGEKEGTKCAADSDLTCVALDGCTGETWSATGLEPCDQTHSDCVVGQGLLIYGTSSRDTLCEVCPTGKYSDESSKARCIEYDPCGPGQGRTGGAEVDKNIVCVPCLVGDGKYSADTNTQPCDDRGLCAVGNGVATLATNTSNTLCRICDGTKEFSDVNDVTACKPLTVCMPGQELDAYGTSSKDTACKPCPVGTFKPDSGPGPCEAHKPCPIGSGVTYAPTAITDTGCGPCSTNTFSPVEDVSLCRNYTTCTKGTGVVAGTKSSGLVDLQCAPCAEGTFSDKNDRSACIDHRQCPIGMGAVMWDGTPFKPGDKRRLMAVKRVTPVANGKVQLPSGRSAAFRSEEELVRMARPRHLRAPANIAASGSAAAAAASVIAYYGTAPLPGLPFPSIMSRHERRLACTRDGSFCHPDFDVGCQNCSFGGFFSNTDATELCQTCSKPCGTGMKESVQCTQTHDRECVDVSACTGNTWSATGIMPCDRTHSNCPVGQGINPHGKGTSSRDTLCVTCGGSTFSDVDDLTVCKTHKTCGIGQGTTSSGSATSDATCAVCASGFFSKRDKHGPCDACRPACDTFYAQSMPCTTFTDRDCRLEGARWSPENFGPCTCLRAKTRAVKCKAPTEMIASDGSKLVVLAIIPDTYCDNATRPLAVTVCIPSRVECPTGVVIGPGGGPIDPTKPVVTAKSCVDTRGSGSGADGGDTRGTYTDGISTQCEYFKIKNECGTYGDSCKKTCGLCEAGVVVVGKPGTGRVSMELWWLGWIIPLIILMFCCCFWLLFCCFRRNKKTVIRRDVHHPQGCTCANCKTPPSAASPRYKKEGLELNMFNPLHASLPPGWAQLVGNRGLPYYFNAMTGQTQWTHPGQAGGGGGGAGAGAKQKNTVRSLPTPRQAQPGSGFGGGGDLNFYKTGDRQKTAAKNAAARQKKRGGRPNRRQSGFQKQATTQITRGARRVSSRWHESIDPITGRTYFFDAVTQAKTWELPTGPTKRTRPLAGVGGIGGGGAFENARNVEAEAYLLHLQNCLPLIMQSHIHRTKNAGDKTKTRTALANKPQQLFAALDDGSTYCALLNAIEDGAVDQRALELRHQVNDVKARVHNVELCLSTARDMHCDVAKFGSHDLLDSHTHPQSILDFTHALISRQVLDPVTAAGVAAVTQNPAHSSSSRRPHDQLLLRWINHVVAASPTATTDGIGFVENYDGFAWHDGKIAENMVRVLFPKHATQAAAGDARPEERWAGVLSALKKAGVKTCVCADYFTPDAGVCVAPSGSTPEARRAASAYRRALGRIAMIFAAQLYGATQESDAGKGGKGAHNESKLTPDMHTGEAALAFLESIGVVVEVNRRAGVTSTRGVEEKNGGNDDDDDQNDDDILSGRVLLRVIERIAPGTVMQADVYLAEEDVGLREGRRRPAGTGALRELAFKYATTSLGLNAAQIGGAPPAEGTASREVEQWTFKFVLALMRVHALRVAGLMHSPDGSPLTDKSLLALGNARVAEMYATSVAGKDRDLPQRRRVPEYATLRDPKLRDSLFFLDIISSADPTIVDWSNVVEPHTAAKGSLAKDGGLGKEDRADNAKYVLSVARKLGSAIPVSWNQVLEGDETGLCLLLAGIMTSSAAAGRWGASGRVDEEQADAHQVPPSPAKARIEGKTFKSWQPMQATIAEQDEEEHESDCEGKTASQRMVPVKLPAAGAADDAALDEWFVMDLNGGGTRGPVTAADVVQRLMREESFNDNTLLSHDGIWAPLEAWQDMGWLDATGEVAVPQNEKTPADSVEFEL